MRTQTSWSFHIQHYAERFDRWSLTEALQRRGLPAAPLLTIADLAANAHLAARHFFDGSSNSPPGDGCVAPVHSSVPPPRRGVCGDRHRDSESTRRKGWTQPQPQPTGCRHSPAPAPHRGQPLTGIRILDLSRVWAGPYGTRYLADSGAEVIKVESGTFPDGRRPDDAAFAEINRNKRYITLNFQLPEGRELLKRLVALGDVVVEFQPPGHGAIRARLSASARGEVRPHHGEHAGLRAERPTQRLRELRSPPRWPTPAGSPLGTSRFADRGPQQDRLPGLYRRRDLALAVTAALHHRARTGQGQHIEIAQVEATATAMEVAFLDYFTRHGSDAQGQS